MDRIFTVEGVLESECKYGGNHYQTPSGLYECDVTSSFAPRRFQLIEGTAPSYNGIRDRDRLLLTMTQIAASFHGGKPRRAMAVADKHGNPCGAGLDIDPFYATEKMLKGDPLAIFGAVIGVNFQINEQLADALLHHALREGET